MASKYYQIAEKLIGRAAGDWMIIAIDQSRHHLSVRCQCKCGAIKIVRVEKIVSGRSRSCGCARDEALIKHGRTKKSLRKDSHEYWIWNSMKQRCNNPNNRGYKDYGARGIKVCERWQEFANFYSDMGRKPEGKSLERRDNNSGYTPDNCYWVGSGEQNSNKRNTKLLTANGETKHLAEWSRCTGVTHSTIISRLRRGWPEDIAVTAPKWTRHHITQL